MTTGSHRANSYTVAWITALKIERAAAMAQLDERHDEPQDFEQNRMDSNSYHWGRVGKHNVVIASLPQGRIGTTPAAVTASHLLASLSWIRFGLLVGIGGGIPQPPHRDIRLGDVVVSQPTKTTGGVVQYDKGAAFSDGKWQRRSVLNSPPAVLLSALSAIQAEHELSEPLLPKLLADMEEKHPRMVRSGYTHPGSMHDRLYISTYTHGEDVPAASEMCDQALIVKRPPRADAEPQIHYGLIASGNTLLKDSNRRESMRLISSPGGGQGDDEEVLCVEMEAAGIVNDFPCLVIKGISDYADSHKNDRWQRYASATAAAYAKELLGYVHAWKLESTQPAIDVMTSIEVEIETMRGTIDKLHVASLDAESQRTIDRLPVAIEAAFDSQAEGDRPRCLPGTRVELLDQARSWVDDAAASSVFWLNGQAGTGKSTITRSLCASVAESGGLAVSFFFKRGDGDRSNPRKLFTTLAWQLARRSQGLALHIKEALEAEPNLINSGLALQFDKLILGPLEKEAASHHASDKTRTSVIFVDALDECQDDDSLDQGSKVKLIIQLFLRARNVGLKVFATSRPELPIRLEFLSHQGTYQHLVLHELPKAMIEEDISTFLRHETALIKLEWDRAMDDVEDLLPQDWPSKADFEALLTMALPLFIFASTICRFMREFRFGSPQEHLQEVLELGAKTPELGLEATYRPILNRLCAGLRPTRRVQLVEKFQTIIGAIVNLASPLSASALGGLLGMPLAEVKRHLDNYHSVLSVPSNSRKPVHLLHLSFRDFLVNPQRRDEEFWIDESEVHNRLVLACIRVMKKYLRRDICCLQWPGTKLGTIEAQCIDRCIPLELRYACLYWPHHMRHSRTSVSEDLIHSFLSVHFLHWIEALVIAGENPRECMKQLYLSFPLTPRLHESPLVRIVVDGKHWLSTHLPTIESRPLQIYSCALLFIPGDSPIRATLGHEMSPWISQAPYLSDSWDTELLYHFHAEAKTNFGEVAFAHDGSLIADLLRKSSLDGPVFIEIRSPDSGRLLNRLRTLTLGGVVAIAFAPDLIHLALAKLEGCIEMWNFNTGECVWTSQDLCAIIGQPNLSTFSFLEESTVMAFTTPSPWSYNRFLLSMRDGKLLGSSSGAKVDVDWHQALALASTEDYVALAAPHSPEKTGGVAKKLIFLHVWNVHLGALIRSTPLAGACRPGVFSPSLDYYASGYGEARSRVWHVHAEEYLHELDTETCGRSMAFSSDNQLFIAASCPGEVKVWGLCSGTVLKSFNIASREQVTKVNPTFSASITFSPNLSMLAALTITEVRVWDTTVEGNATQLQPAVRPTEKKNVSCLSYATISHDSHLVATWLEDHTGFELWRTSTGEHKRFTLDPSNRPRQEKASCHVSPNTEYLADTLVDDLITIRRIHADLDTSFECKLEGSPPVAFSPDSSIVAINVPKVGIDIVKLGSPGGSRTLHLDADVKALGFSADSTMVAVAFRSTISVFSTTTGQMVSKIDADLERPIVSVAFSSDSSMLAAITNVPAAGVYDLKTGELIDAMHMKRRRTFERQLDEAVRFWPDGGVLTRRRAFAPEVSPDGTQIWEPAAYPGLGLTPDGSWITWNGYHLMWIPLNYQGRLGVMSEEVLLFQSLGGDVEMIKFAPGEIPSVEFDPHVDSPSVGEFSRTYKRF